MITEAPRFAGIGRLYGTEALARLACSHVVVVGIGGVGSWVAEALARTGIGRISLIDMDEVCVSNVNRQLHALDGQVGKPKVEVMAERLRAISPSCEVRAVMDFVTPNNLAELITDDISCVVDCIDSVNAKVALIAWCRRRKIPVITTGGAGGQIDPTQITVADLSKTVNDPLAAKVMDLMGGMPHGAGPTVEGMLAGQNLKGIEQGVAMDVPNCQRRKWLCGLGCWSTPRQLAGGWISEPRAEKVY